MYQLTDPEKMRQWLNLAVYIKLSRTGLIQNLADGAFVKDEAAWNEFQRNKTLKYARHITAQDKKLAKTSEAAAVKSEAELVKVTAAYDAFKSKELGKISAAKAKQKNKMQEAFRKKDEKERRKVEHVTNTATRLRAEATARAGALETKDRIWDNLALVEDGTAGSALLRAYDAKDTIPAPPCCPGRT